MGSTSHSQKENTVIKKSRKVHQMLSAAVQKFLHLIFGNSCFVDVMDTILYCDCGIDDWGFSLQNISSDAASIEVRINR